MTITTAFKKSTPLIAYNLCPTIAKIITRNVHYLYKYGRREIVAIVIFGRVYVCLRALSHIDNLFTINAHIEKLPHSDEWSECDLISFSLEMYIYTQTSTST